MVSKIPVLKFLKKKTPSYKNKTEKEMLVSDVSILNFLNEQYPLSVFYYNKCIGTIKK